MNVAIQGDGVAARCSAYLLKKAGHKVWLECAERPRVPVVMLSAAALTLLRDILDDPGLFRNAPLISRRTVAWGSHSEAKAFEHSAVVVSEQELLDGIGGKIDLAGGTDAHVDWTIVAARPLRAGSEEQHVGSRTAFATPVALAGEADARSCWIESLAQGWLFLIPNTAGAGWLLSVGRHAEALLLESKIIAAQIDKLSGPGREFLASPRITSPLCGEGWLACGSAAVSFDPICGDGTAYAAREAILAFAVIQSAAGGEKLEDLLAHYRDHIVRGFSRHLELCRELYRSGQQNRWWEAQVESAENGLRWSTDRLRNSPNARFRLNGFRLSRLAE